MPRKYPKRTKAERKTTTRKGGIKLNRKQKKTAKEAFDFLGIKKTKTGYYRK